MKDPINNIIWRNTEELRANHWNPNRVHKMELKLLEHSLLSTGWIQPILTNETGLIIDGFHRWRLSQDSKAVRERYDGKVPVATLPVDDATAMAITVRINRAKGTHVAIEMHNLVVSLITEHGWTREQVAKEIGANLDEVDALAQEGIFAAKKIKDWAYSNAWYPGEGPVGGEAGTQWAREQGLSI
jgi:ParB-like chromosome segregation protein Spo0J